MSPAVHVDFQIYVLTDSQIAQLCFLEIRIHPDVAQRTNRHQTLTCLHVIAGIHVAPCDHAIDLRANRAVSKIESGLVEIALSLHQTGLGLFQGRRVLDHVGIDAVDIAAGIAPVEFLHHLLRREIVG